MQEIRNSANKLVCKVDKDSKTVEIIVKGCKTAVSFVEGGVKIINAKVTA